MVEVRLTTSEIAYIIHVLSKHYLEEEDIRNIIRLLIAHMPQDYEQK